MRWGRSPRYHIQDGRLPRRMLQSGRPRKVRSEVRLRRRLLLSLDARDSAHCGAGSKDKGGLLSFKPERIRG